ncbi:hypothetical protein Nepgr_001310 [Nepenthes gracilis]|uniref:Uncharacterized protein n=1 Tax=Nepenthes gracilis TaxID=150966 RepID=A0AAD3P469_NEPGR|nr:hypothetical protein Nepgr_001310 [Nepenthes gracilis]
MEGVKQIPIQGGLESGEGAWRGEPKVYGHGNRSAYVALTSLSPGSDPDCIHSMAVALRVNGVFRTQLIQSWSNPIDGHALYCVLTVKL